MSMSVSIKNQIGWVARSKGSPHYFGGHAAKCIVYSSRRRALSAQRFDQETDEEVLRRWDILPVYIEEPNP